MKNVLVRLRISRKLPRNADILVTIPRMQRVAPPGVETHNGVLW